MRIFKWPVGFMMRHDKAITITYILVMVAIIAFDLIVIAPENWTLWFNGFSAGNVFYMVIYTIVHYFRRRKEWIDFNAAEARILAKQPKEINTEEDWI